GVPGPEVADQEAAKQAGQAQAGPLGGGEDAVVAGGGALGQPLDGAQQVADGAAAGGPGGGHGQPLRPLERGAGGGGGEQGEDGQGVGGYAGHGGLLARCRGWSVNPMIPHRRPPSWRPAADH